MSLRTAELWIFTLTECSQIVTGVVFDVYNMNSYFL